MQDHHWIALAVSVGASLATVAAFYFKAWLRGDVENEAPVGRQLVAYLIAYLAGFSAIAMLPVPWSRLFVACAAALAFAVSHHGRAPLATREFARTAGLTLVVILSLWVVYEIFLSLGVDLLARATSSALAAPS